MSKPGYETTEIVVDSHGDVNVGSVYLSDVMVLGEIEVKANKVFESNGKTILFPSNNEVKTSPTTISLFLNYMTKIGRYRT